MKVGKFAGYSLSLGLVVRLLFYPQEFRVGVLFSVIAVVLVLCTAAVAVIHLYVVLAGGVMDLDERQRYLEELR